MSTFALSSEQAVAVHHARGDAVVVAGAGSGKTRVLTARFVHLVRDRSIPIRSIAALTFTKRAAREMRERIAGTFEALGDTDALAEIERAEIATIHAWCASLLRRHAVAAGVDPGFRVLDEAGEAALLIADAAAAADARLAEDAAGRAAMRAIGRWLSPRPRADLIRLLRAVRGQAGNVAGLRWAHGPDVDPASVGAAVADASAAIASIDVEPVVRRVVERRLEGIARALDDPTPEGRAFALLDEAGALRDLSVSRRAPWTKARTALLHAIDALAACDLDRVGETHLLPALREVLGAYDDAYAEAKRDRGVLDFDDLERGALEFLMRLEREQRPLEGAPRVVLVDEFQDTNSVQARLLAHLRRQGAEQMVVGDPKQSIYRFRRADVRVLLGERKRVGPASEILLATSYRAAPELVAVVNGLNERLFAGGAAGVAYEPLRAGGRFAPPASPGEPPVEILFVTCPGRPIDEGTRVEARAVAGWIRALVDARIPRRKADVDGPFGFGDIAILVRSRKRLAVFERALLEAGVPHRAVGGRGWHQAEEIADLRDALRVIHDPEDRHAVAAFLSGPIVRASDDAIVACFEPDRVESPWDLWCANASDDADRRVATVVARLRDEAVLGSLTAVVEGVLDDLGLFAATLAGPDGIRRAANLRKALPIARALEEAGRRGLGDLLRQLARLDQEGADEGDAPLGGVADDTVLLMTVHAAKGLEFPVVILADVGRGVSSGNSGAIAFDPEHGVATKLRSPLLGVAYPSAGYAVAGERERIADDHEARRLLYVATTRAEERLLITGALAGVQKNGQPKGMKGWGRDLLTAVGVSPETAVTIVPCGEGADASVRVAIVDAADVREVARPTPTDAAMDTDEVSVLLDEVRRDPAPLGTTRFVVSVTELVTFADSPARWYEQVALGMAGHDARRLELDDEEPRDVRDDDEAFARDPRDRHAAAIGNAVHAYIERFTGPDRSLDRDLLDEVLADAFGAPVPNAAAERARTLVERFLGCPFGARLARELAAGSDVRREMSFHVRVRFPDGRRVGPFEGLLVRGSVDLWLPTERGVLLVDHKTVVRSFAQPTPEAVATRHAVQLRLYALAAERVEGADVAGAGLLLLDPSWGPEPVFATVDVGGDAARETRELVEAFARAELERRRPARWRDLLGP